MEQLQAFYQELADKNSGKLQKTQQKIRKISMLRLSVVLAAVLLIYLLWYENAWLPGTIVMVAVAGMIFLIKKHNKLFREKDYISSVIRVSKEELSALNDDFSAFDGANEKINDAHVFSRDIDLFGAKSLFQSLNRTVTAYGKEILSDGFQFPLTNKQQILNRQEAVKELASRKELTLDFRAKGLLHPSTMQEVEELKSLTTEPSFLLPKKHLWKILTYAYPVAWTAIIILTIAGFLPSSAIITLIIVCYALSESQVKKINRLQNSLEKKIKIIASYADLIGMIESNTFKSLDLQHIQSQLTGEQKNTSKIMAELSQLLNNLDQRSGGIGRFILNTLFLWDIRYALRMEEWKEKYSYQLDKWMKALGAFDALCSLGIFTFNHPGYTFPSISEEYFCLEATEVGHPLLHREVCVKNDILIEKHPFFLIITGANMAGKSTYLRTISVNYLLASVGAPVWATSFRFYPAQLVTSLRTSDSLNDNESYFFAELKRLKMIIDRLKSGERLFIVLDEILKGTNSVDKQKGSLALMKQLVSMNACGIIATHDLALGRLESAFPEHIKNYRFEAEIKNNRLFFSYRMQPGIAENMNACFLMNQMGIIVEE